MAEKKRPGQKMKLQNVDEILGVVGEERALEIDISEITPFKDHPFKVIDDDKMEDLVNSIRLNGVLTPVLVRPMGKGYEMISGHRRMHAAIRAGLTMIPVISREMDDEAATITMVESNAQREEVLPSEKAFAYKMKYEALKTVAGRPEKNSSQVGTDFPKARSDEILAEQVDESRMQVQRYIRLTKLIPPLLAKVDDGTLKFVPASDFLSHLSEKEQTYLAFIMERDEAAPSLDQAKRMKQISEQGKLTEEVMDVIMREEKPLERKITIRDDRLKRFFPKSYTPQQIEDVIMKLLEGWYRRRQQEQAR